MRLRFRHFVGRHPTQPAQDIPTPDDCVAADTARQRQQHHSLQTDGERQGLKSPGEDDIQGLGLHVPEQYGRVGIAQQRARSDHV